MTYVWDPRCHARCDNRFESNLNLFLTLMAMEEAGWYVVNDGDGFSKVLCPEHVTFEPGEVWLVECAECYYEEYYNTEEDAEDDAYEHNHCTDFSDCGCYHDAKVLSPEQQDERNARRREREAHAKARLLASEAHRRYVDFLIERDQKERNGSLVTQERGASRSRRVGVSRHRVHLAVQPRWLRKVQQGK